MHFFLAKELFVCYTIDKGKGKENETKKLWRKPMKDALCAVAMISAAVIFSGLSAAGALYICHEYGFGPVWEIVLSSLGVICSTVTLVSFFFKKGWM